VFTLLGGNGVTLKAKKCHLFSNEVEYLGHVIRPGRISVNEKNLKAIRKAIYPKTQTQLRSLLGMCNKYRRFTAGFAKVAKPLNKLVSSSLPKKLCPPTVEEQAAFDRLREQLCHPPISARTNNRLNRWRIRLAEFDYNVEYKPGRQHAIADALSRMPTEGLNTTPIPEDIPVVGVTTRSGAVLDPRRPENKGQVPISMAELAKEQLANSISQEICKDMDTTDRTRFYENGDGILCRHGQQEGTQQVVVPRSLVTDVLER